METVLEGTWNERWRSRLHLSPEGMSVVHSDGQLAETVEYSQVKNVGVMAQGRRYGLLSIDLGSKGIWVLSKLHPLQAQFGASLIQEQLAALQRAQMPVFAERQPLAQIPQMAHSLLSGSGRGVIEVLDFLITQAAFYAASDVHFEPFPPALKVRFRLDGVLVDVVELPSFWLPRILARLKILAEMAVYRSDIPQEGRFQVRVASRRIDVRASLLPTLHGEKAVLRLFDPSRTLMQLDQLGMPDDVRTAWERLLQQPQGMLVLTGPSNHGKTTTLYASLMHLHQSRRDLSNLCTVEDPVEHDLRVVNQTQVNPAVGLTFASGLRTVLRQDPEVIMLGEIRDEETAEIAVRAGLTGHLILTTAHARSAPGVFPRLIDLGCPAALVAGALTGVLSQRLIRTVCPECKTAAQPTVRQKHAFQPGEGQWVQGRGCEACARTGYAGRTGVFHLLEPDDAFREAVAAGAPGVELERLAGKANLHEAALALAAAGRTTLDEVERVIGGAA